MNLFMIDRDPVQAAKYLHDKHVVKMVLEGAQLLSSALTMRDLPAPYRLSHAHHPWTIWTAYSMNQWLWVKDFVLPIGHEFEYRYGKVHSSTLAIQQMMKDKHWRDLPQVKGPMKAFPQSVHERMEDAYEAYRFYYATHKVPPGTTWRKRSPPPWLDSYNRPEQTT